MADYAHPETLVTTDWVAEHANDPTVAVVEVDVDTAAYDQEHIPGAIGWNWQTQLCDTVQRNIIPKDELERLLGTGGIGNDTTIVLYGDNNNWFAAWALWQLKMYGHKDVRLMNGGRKKWLAEKRQTTTDAPKPTPFAAMLIRSMQIRVPDRRWRHDRRQTQHTLPHGGPDGRQGPGQKREGG